MQGAVIIVGGGGHALVVWDLLDCMGYRVCGLTDPGMAAGTLLALGDETCPILGDDQVLADHLSTDPDVKLFSGVGPDPVEVRRSVTGRLAAAGTERMIAAIHPRAVLATSVRLGLDVAVMAGAVINPCVEIGCHCVINTGATVDHECTIADNVFIQPGAHLAGRVVVGNGAVIGMGANIREGLCIGKNAYVAGGAFVKDDVPDGVVVAGVPARFLRNRF